jgi:Cu(I)/Ag(I) efflux system membrane fusion protein
MKYTFLFFSLLIVAACSDTPPHHHTQAPVPAAEESAALMLNETQARLANITTQKLTASAMGPEIVINGRIMADQQRSQTISSRAAGRIEKLYLKETGRPLRQGEPLYELYSETLLTLQQEYLLAKTQENMSARYASLATSAEKKLLRYGMTPAQIAHLAQQKTAAARITFMAPASGLVTQVAATEGQYVGEGALLYRMEDTRSLWVEGDLYRTEASQIKRDDAVSIQVDGATAPVVSTVIFLAPQYRNGSQITVVRAPLKNEDGLFTPGMQARMTFTTPGPRVLTVPLHAVIRDAKGAHLYVQTAPHTYRPRRVKTGAEDYAWVEITKGLVENEVVVTTGAYLLYSEIMLKKGGVRMGSEF